MIWTYSPEDVQILVAGIYAITGYVEGTFISIKKDVQPFTTSRTADGKLNRTQREDKGYTLEISIAQSSTSNDVLNKLLEIDQVTGLGQFPIFIKDGNGSSLFFTSQAFISSVPDVEFSNSISTRTWTIQCEDGFLNVGGNDGKSGVLEDALNLLTSSTPFLKSVLGL